jgi:hypothetical protein
MTPGSLDVENLEEAKKKVLSSIPTVDVLFHHHIMTGTMVGGANLEELNELVLPREEVEKKSRWVIGGHIHKAQVLSKQTFVTGSVFTQEVNEKGKSVWILDTEKEEMKEVMLPVRGIYQIEANYGDTFDGLPKHSIVKVVITDIRLKDQVDNIKEQLSKLYDSSIVVESYPNERTKVFLDDTGGLDLSIENLLKVYSEVKEIPLSDLKDAMALLENNE